MLGERTQFHQALWGLTLLLATLFAEIGAATPALVSLSHQAPPRDPLKQRIGDLGHVCESTMTSVAPDIAIRGHFRSS